MHRINILIREKSNVSVMRTQAITHRRPRDEKCYLAKKDLRIQAQQANSEASAPVSSCSGTVVEKFDGRATDDLFEEVDGDRTPTSKDFERQRLEEIAEGGCLRTVFRRLLGVAIDGRCSVGGMALRQTTRPLRVDDRNVEK